MTYYKGKRHGEHCNSKTYPTNCKQCGSKIFYFSCDCGCKVFFEELGHPWNVHHCRPIELQVYLPQGYEVDNGYKNPIKKYPPIISEDSVTFIYIVNIKESIGE